MAFLRFHRDKRGYEHFYLVEATTNRRGKSRARVLYWFRTPPNVKVGREPFDDDVRREIEAQNPGVTFDWQKIAETPIPSADAERWRERRRQERAAKAARRLGGEQPTPDVEDEEDIEPPIAEVDASVDAAEQQADALAPTEESLVSTAATVDDLGGEVAGLKPAVTGEEFAGPKPGATDSAGVAQPFRAAGEHRRRRRRRGRRRDVGGVPASGPPADRPHEADLAPRSDPESSEPDEPGDPPESSG
jgi:hypothetical protein